MFKKVNIKPQGPIYSLRVPITAPMMGVQMSVGDIARCLHARALVTEVLPNGMEVRLNLSNYDKDNTVGLAKEEVKEVKVEIMDKVDAEAPVQQVEVPKTSKTKVEEGAEIVDAATTETAVVSRVEEEPVKEEPVKTMKRDPKYFQEIEKQYKKIKNNK